jgi:hypothetical protein
MPLRHLIVLIVDAHPSAEVTLAGIRPGSLRYLAEWIDGHI